MADLPSILGGMAQGFLDFGKSAVDLFGTGGAAVGDLVDTIRTGKVSTKNQDDFRKWLYNTDSVQDAAAKGLGTALNGVQTVSDYIPGIGAVTRNPLFNAGQGALGGLADEFKTYGKDYDLGRAGQRAAVSAGAALASGGLGDALKKSANPLLSSGAVQGLARGAAGGAISGGGYAAIDGGDIAQSALQGAGMGALIGGATGAIQDFMPRKATYDMALTDEEKAARIANAKNMLANEQNPERIAELNSQIKDLGGTLADADMAVNSPRYITDENGNPMTLYHGSPNKNITEFDINQAGKNTRSGERALYFTDSPEVADEFSYERIPTDDLFVENRGAKGRVYPVNLEMNNPLDLDNLTDAQIDELWPYASYMGSWQGKDVFTRDLKNWRDVNNAQLIKGYLDMDKLAGSPYDGFMARMYPNQDNQAREYAVFDNSKVKMLEDLQAVNDANIMASRILPDELDLGRTLAGQDMTVNSAKIAPGQLGLFDQPVPTEQIEEALALDGKYSPKDNKVTRAMRARAEEIIGDYKTGKKVPENDLYNKIDESTLPSKRKSTGAILDDLYSKGVKPDEVSNKVLDQLVEKEMGGKMDKKSLATYLFGDMDDAARKDFIKKNLYTTKDYDVDDLTESILKNWARRKAMGSGTLNKYNIDSLALSAGNKTIRQGYTGALDSALSERLGIAPGNTYKQNGEFDTPGALGRYIGSESRPDFNNYMVREVPDIEEALNTAGHERLHSFQTESRLEDRYSKEVADAYNGLASDLKKANAYKSDAEIKNRYKKGTEYWGDTDEQEARMLQQYLGARGFTDYNKRDARMYGGLEFDNDKIVPAFDKFFDKLRDMSKRGIALPALTALFGGGALMANQQKDKEEVR